MQEKSFFSNISFDPKLLTGFAAKYLLNFRLVILLVVLILGIGSFSYANLPRRLNPEVKIPITIVTVVMPGAGPGDIETLVVDPLEKEIKNVKGIDTYTSTSQEGLAVISIQFKTGKDPEKARDEVASAVDGVRLPEAALKPIVKKLDFEDRPIWTFAVTTTKDFASLQNFARNLKIELKDGPYTDRVETIGSDIRYIKVQVRQDIAKTLKLQSSSIKDAISAALASFPAGTITGGDNEFAVTMPKKVFELQDFEKIYVNIDGTSIKLTELATFGFDVLPGGRTTYFVDPQKAPQKTVIFYVYKNSAANIDVAEKSFRSIVDAQVAKYNKSFDVKTIDSNASQVEEQFAELLGEFQSAIFLVFLLLFIFLGLRQAIISSITFPLTFLSAFTLMKLWGLSIDFISLFGFLIALGLLIDDTIVTVTAMTRYHQTGKFTGTQTGLLVWRDFIVPLWSTTITTIWAFLPLLLSTGIIGEFIKPIPLVVTFAMVSSTSIAVLITLPAMMRLFDAKIPTRVKTFAKAMLAIAFVVLLFVFIPKSPVYIPTILLAMLGVIIVKIALPYAIAMLRNKQTAGENVQHHTKINLISQKVKHGITNGFVNLESISFYYKQLISYVLEHKSVRRQIIIGIAVFTLCGFALPAFGLVKNEFFPKSDSLSLFVAGSLGASATVAQQDVVGDKLMRDVVREEGVKYAIYSSNTKLGANESIGVSNGSFLITIRLQDEADRELKSYEIAEKLRVLAKKYTYAKVEVAEQSGGPPAGADVVVKFKGDDLVTLEKMADAEVAYLKKSPGLTNIKKSLEPGAGRVTFNPDMAKINEYGVNEFAVGGALRSAITGDTIGKLKLQDEEYDIIYKTTSGRRDATELGTIEVDGRPGRYTIATLGNFTLSPNPSVIAHEDGKRVISVTAGVLAGGSVTDANKIAIDYAKNNIDYPQGYFLDTGGVNEENQKSVASILQAMLLSFVLIFVTMVIEFRSFRLAVLTLLCVPLAISGVFYVFGLAGIPLSFPALIGVLALFGIVVTTAIVIVEKINENLEHGLLLREAIVDAAGSRLEPIVLTSLSTIVGLIPISIADPVWRGLGGAIIAGLIFSGIFKLFFIPIIYQAWMGEE